MHASSAGLASQLAFELKTGVDVMGVFGSGGNGGGVERAEGYVGPPWEEVLKLMAEDAQKF